MEPRVRTTVPRTHHNVPHSCLAFSRDRSPTGISVPPIEPARNRLRLVVVEEPSQPTKDRLLDPGNSTVRVTGQTDRSKFPIASRTAPLILRFTLDLPATNGSPIGSTSSSSLLTFRRISWSLLKDRGMVVVRPPAKSLATKIVKDLADRRLARVVKKSGIQIRQRECGFSCRCGSWLDAAPHRFFRSSPWIKCVSRHNVITVI